MMALVSAPILTAFIVRFFPTISSKVPPIIARIFSPLVLITLIVYLVAMAVSGKNPYQDREFLVIFNMLLVGVMAIIVFSVSETASGKKQRFNEITLLLLSVVTLVVNLVALSAIVYRLGEYGFTPNRTAVLGSNLLIFIHLAWIMIDLLKVNLGKADLKKVENTIATYLPVYAAWTIIVIFFFPMIFGWWEIN
jgi:lipopolysaccharide export LptBFGC system permease protein LptF